MMPAETNVHDAALARERGLWEAYRSRDRVRIERLIDPDALDVGVSGTRTRDSVVSAVQLMEIRGYAIDGFHVHAFGETEIVTYRSAVDGTYKGQPFASRDVVATTVWMRREGEWRVVHRHESPALGRG